MAKVFLDVRKQFGLDSIPVGPNVSGVDRVGIVVKRIGVLDLDYQKPRKIRRDPLLVRLVRLFLLDSVVAGNVEALVVVGLESGVGRRGPEAVEVYWKMAVKDGERVPRLGVRVEALRHEHVRAEIHRAPPKTSQQLRLNAHVADILRIFQRRNGRDFLGERERSGGGTAD